MKTFFAKIWLKIKNFFINLGYSLKPRFELQWLVTAVLLLLVVVYAGFGIYFGIQDYGKHSESAAAKSSTKIYPLPAA